MNVLITCAGRRGYLVEYFKDVVHPLGGRVITVNSERYAAGFLAGDRRVLAPRVDDPAYLPLLIDLIEREGIGLVLSLFDIDLPILAAARDRFRALGAEVAVADRDSVEIANDKWRMFQALEAAGIPTPATWLDVEAALAAVDAGEARFPLVVKPRRGMGSIGVRTVSDASQLAAAHAAAAEAVARTYVSILARDRPDREVLIQSVVDGREHGADVLNDLEGRHLATVVKRKLAMRPEGADFAEVVAHPEIEALCARLSALLGHRGNLDVDVMATDDGPPVVLELNARFGGGYPFSHLAGARFPRALVQSAKGETPDPGRARPGVIGMLDIAPRAVTTRSIEEARA